MKWLFNIFRSARSAPDADAQRTAEAGIEDSEGGADFPEDGDALFSALAPYVAARRPLDFFFEMYAVNVLKLLPARTLQALDEFSKEYPDFFQKHDGDWQRYVVKELHLSDTIEVALWDLWIKNSETLRARDEIYEPWDYARDFLEQYLADDSQVDVWTDESLEAAKFGLLATAPARSNVDHESARNIASTPEPVDAATGSAYRRTRDRDRIRPDGVQGREETTARAPAPDD